MQGLMMDTPLTISAIAEHVAKFHGGREIVSVTADNPRHRYTWAEAMLLAKKLAAALKKLGFQQGDRLGTIAWNDYRHLEIYYGVGGAGYICHTINPRLFPEQLNFIINHAEDRLLAVDPMFLPLIEKIAEHLKSVEGIIVLTDEAHMPESSLDNLHCYETLVGAESGDFDWPEVDERSASAFSLGRGALQRGPVRGAEHPVESPNGIQ